MKKLLFTAYNLEIGGIEKALIALFKSIDYQKYEVTLILEEIKGELLNDLPSEVIVKEYKIDNSHNILKRKIKNRFNLIKNIIKNYNKYDFSCCYAPYSIPCPIIVRYMSKNNAIWIHTNYTWLYKNQHEVKEFFKKRKISKFKNIIFVSNEAEKDFEKIYPKLSNKLKVCNNLIDKNLIFKKSEEKVSEIKPNVPLFINVSRQEEKSKKITRLIEAAHKLKVDKYEFEVWLIGDGENHNQYQTLINTYNLESTVKLIGLKQNPYPYFKMSDCYVLTSDYEGFPVVYLESIVMNKPIIGTIDVTDGTIKINNNYGKIVEKNAESIYNAMKDFLNNKITITMEFNIDGYNQNILNTIEDLFENN